MHKISPKIPHTFYTTFYGFWEAETAKKSTKIDIVKFYAMEIKVASPILKRSLRSEPMVEISF